MSHNSICFELALKCLLLQTSQPVSKSVPVAMSSPLEGKSGGSDEECGEPQQPLIGLAAGRVGNTIGPRNAPNPARPAFPRPEAGALYPPDIGSTRPGPDYSTTRPARESPTRESPELPRFQVRILQSPLFFLFGGPSPVGSAVGCLSEQRTKPHKTRQAGCEFPAQVSGLSLW
jgi:hypothetical protein